MSFKIEFGSDWDKIRKSFKTDETVRKILPDVTVAILKLHNTLERRVGELFTAPKPLSSVMIGSSKSPSEIGKTFLRYNLQYRSVPVYLSVFEHTEEKSIEHVGKIPRITGLNLVRWTPAKVSIVTTSFVRRGKGSIPRRVKGSRFKGFFQKGIIFARKYQRTWEQPGIIRKYPLQPLYGPRLSTLASKVYDIDVEVAKAKETLQTDLISAILRSYS